MTRIHSPGVIGELSAPARLATPVALAISGVAFLAHEQSPWFFARAAFLHHLIGWTLILGALFPLGLAFRPRSTLFRSGYGLLVVALAVMLYCDRDIAAVFGAGGAR